MIFPYIARIVAEPFPGHTIEVVRFPKQPMPDNIRCWTSDLVSPWWIEWRLPDKHCITSRPKIRDINAKTAPAFHLSAEDKLKLEPSFKYEPV